MTMFLEAPQVPIVADVHFNTGLCWNGIISKSFEINTDKKTVFQDLRIKS